MVQGRFQGPGPNSMPPNGRFMQPPNFQRMQPRHNPFQQQMPQQSQMGRQPRANGPFQQQPPQQSQMGRQPRANGPFQQQPPKKEGLLGKLLGKSKQNTAPPNLFAPPSQVKQETRNSGGGLIETLKNPEGISSMLNNTQRVLQAAEQFTPMIQQYGPIVKNLPSIWKIMRAFKSSDDEKEETKSEETIKEKSTVKVQQKDSSNSHNEQEPKQRVQKKNNGSVPKLYI